MLWAISGIFCILFLVGITRLNRRPVLRTKDEVLDILNLWLNDSISSGEWDYFENCEIQNPELEGIRKYCAQLSLDPEFTVNSKASSSLNAKGKAELSRIIARLNSASVSATPNPTVKRDAP